MRRNAGLTALLAAMLGLAAPELAGAQRSGHQIAPLTPIDIPTLGAVTADIRAYYPEQALRLGVVGRAMLNCRSNADGTLSDCLLVSEFPEGYGFGAAALKMASVQLAPWSGPAGGRVATPVVFNPADAQAAERAAQPSPEPRRLTGPPSPPASRVKPGETIVTEPFAYNRTAVLTNEVTGHTLLVMGLKIPAGSPGFYAGQFGTGPGRAVNTWCFVPPPSKGRFKPTCLMLYRDEAAVVPRVVNGYAFSHFGIPSSGRMDYANSPTFVEQPVDIPGDLRLDYRLRRWTKTAAEVEIWANGEIADLKVATKGPDGRALLQTLGGAYWLSQPADDRKAARVEPST